MAGGSAARSVGDARAQQGAVVGIERRLADARSQPAQRFATDQEFVVAALEQQLGGVCGRHARQVIVG